jgi:hypothetical protein
MELDRNGMEVLSREECLALLAGSPIGRVIVTMSALPAAFPVNFAVHDGDIVFRTGQGTKLQAAVRNAVVAFEVDGFEPFGHTGWSVLVTGRATEITDTSLAAAGEGLALGPWLPTRLAAFVRIGTDMMSGRRLSLEASARFRLDGPLEPTGMPWSGPGLDACLVCGCDQLLAVTDGEVANLVCTGCAACWHVEAGWVRRVVPRNCPGCAFKRNCAPASLADAVIKEGAR